MELSQTFFLEISTNNWGCVFFVSTLLKTTWMRFRNGVQRLCCQTLTMFNLILIFRPFCRQQCTGLGSPILTPFVARCTSICLTAMCRLSNWKGLIPRLPRGLSLGLASSQVSLMPHFAVALSWKLLIYFLEASGFAFFPPFLRGPFFGSCFNVPRGFDFFGVVNFYAQKLEDNFTSCV